MTITPKFPKLPDDIDNIKTPPLKKGDKGGFADVELVLLSKLHAMSGETSSPADGGHVCRGLPPSAALRWNHYSFVSPCHPPHPTLSSLFLVAMSILLNVNASLSYAEFSYQNPSRTALEEMETRPTGAQQLVASRFQRQEAVSKLEAIALEKELSRLSKELEKTHKENQNFRLKAQQYLETEKLRASGRTQQARAERELGFEYFHHENGMLELYRDGLVEEVLNEPVDETNEEGQVVGRTVRDTVDIEYFKGGPYHRLRKHFKVITLSERGQVQTLDREILEYIPGSKWYGTDDPKLTNNFQMVQKYKDITTDSVEPAKREVRIVSGIIHNGDRKPSEWLEAKSGTDTAVMTLTLYKGARYGGTGNEMDQYESVSWNSQFPDLSTVAEWNAVYKHGLLKEEHTFSTNMGPVNIPTDITEPMFKDLEQTLVKVREDMQKNPTLASETKLSDTAQSKTKKRDAEEEAKQREIWENEKQAFLQKSDSSTSPLNRVEQDEKGWAFAQRWLEWLVTRFPNFLKGSPMEEWFKGAVSTTR